MPLNHPALPPVSQASASTIGAAISRTFWIWARLLGGAAILAALVWRQGAGPFVDGLRLTSPVALLTALVVTAGTTLCCAWRWSLVGATSRRRRTRPDGLRRLLPLAVPQRHPARRGPRRRAPRRAPRSRDGGDGPRAAVGRVGPRHRAGGAGRPRARCGRPPGPAVRTPVVLAAVVGVACSSSWSPTLPRRVRLILVESSACSAPCGHDSRSRRRSPPPAMSSSSWWPPAPPASPPRSPSSRRWRSSSSSRRPCRSASPAGVPAKVPRPGSSAPSASAPPRA